MCSGSLLLLLDEGVWVLLQQVEKAVLCPQVVLHIETKMFDYLHQSVFRQDNGQAVSSLA